MEFFRQEYWSGLPPSVPEQFSDTNLRYKYIGLCAFEEKAYKVIFADYVKVRF